MHGTAITFFKSTSTLNIMIVEFYLKYINSSLDLKIRIRFTLVIKIITYFKFTKIPFTSHGCSRRLVFCVRVCEGGWKGWEEERS